MKIEELSVNNWVLYNNKPAQITDISLTQDHIGITFDSNHFICSIKKIKPMLLTDEILELNGAIKHCLDEYETDWNFFNSGCFIEKIYGTDHYDLEQYGDTIEIRYVHELQNLLRLFKKWNQEIKIK